MREMKDSAFCKPSCLFVHAVVAILLFAVQCMARSDDVVILKNGDRLTGEIKSLQRGELRFKASYMAESVRLDWTKIDQLESRGKFQIFLVDGKLFNDSVRMTASTSSETDNVVIG